MVYKLFLLWTLFLLARLQDLLPFLQPIRPILILTSTTTGGVILGGYRKRLSSVLTMTQMRLYLIFFFVMIFGIPFAYHKRDAFEFTFLNYSSNILFFLIFLLQINTLKRLEHVICIISVSVFAYGAFGYLYGASSDGRLQTYGILDANDTAYVLVSLCPVCIFYLMFNKGLLKRLLAISALCTSVAMILQTGSRGGIMAFGAVILMTMLTKIGGIKSSYKILLIVLLGVSGWLVRDQIDLERFRSIFTIESDYNMVEEGGRFQIWERAITLTLQHPITGIGVSCFPMAIGYRRAELGLLPKWQPAHNSYLQVSAEMGILGLIVFMRLILTTLNTLLRASRMKPASGEALQVRAFAGLVLLGFVGHLIAAFYLTQGYSIFFTLFFALGAVIRKLQLDLTGGEPSPARNAVGRSKSHRVCL